MENRCQNGGRVIKAKLQWCQPKHTMMERQRAHRHWQQRNEQLSHVHIIISTVGECAGNVHRQHANSLFFR